VHNNAVLVMDVGSGYWSDPYGRQYVLDKFPFLTVKKKKLPTGKLTRQAFKAGLRLGMAFCEKLPISIRPIISEAYPRRYQEEVHRTKYIVNPYLIGYWASYRYYQDIAAELRRDLIPPRPVDTSALNILREIESVRSCSIHWRSYSEESGVFHPSLTEYYRSATSLIERRHPDIRFFVFSDDPVAARKTLTNIKSNTVFVNTPNSKGNAQSLIDFYLMYSCDHLIIADSTYSWWAAWLSDKENKIIVAPRGLSPWGDDSLPSHWVGLLNSRS